MGDEGFPIQTLHNCTQTAQSNGGTQPPAGGLAALAALDTPAAPHTAHRAPTDGNGNRRSDKRHCMAHAPPPLARAPHKQEQVSTPDMACLCT